MKNSLVLFALLGTLAGFSLPGCGGHSDEVVPAPATTAEDSGAPPGVDEAEYAKAMAESMKNQ